MPDAETARPTVLLFDVDGTLLSTAGAGRRAVGRAFAELYGREDACSLFRFDGMTDRAIVRLGLDALGVEVTEQAVAAVLETYVEVLEEEVCRADPQQYRVFPGIRDALGAARTAGHALGLGTGNMREGARLKLERVGLFDQFSFGGFGCDAEDRIELVRIGAERGAALCGRPREQCRVVVIGDTPKDAAAAQAVGAECIGVGTGSHSPEQLLAGGANHAFADLAAPGALDALIGPAASGPA